MNQLATTCCVVEKEGGSMFKELLPRQWAIMGFYQRFESLIALCLTLIVTLVVLVAIYRLSVGVIADLILRAHNPLEYAVFQKVFGEIMTVLIALEFNHTLQYVVTRQQSIIQTKVIILIALLAVARKFIILDIKETAFEVLIGLGVVSLALGIVYWLLREKEE
jgi:uncharacterized membrane protein (DUF373 family)